MRRRELSTEKRYAVFAGTLRLYNSARLCGRRRRVRPMALRMTIACGDYDRTRRVIDGRIAIPGCAPEFAPPRMRRCSPAPSPARIST
jgi:hypothetical protein